MDDYHINSAVIHVTYVMKTLSLSFIEPAAHIALIEKHCKCNTGQKNRTPILLYSVQAMIVRKRLCHIYSSSVSYLFLKINSDINEIECCYYKEG